MTPTQVVNHYGTISKAARELGVTYQAVQHWVKTNEIPEVRQWAIQAKTGGELMADLPTKEDAKEAV